MNTSEKNYLRGMSKAWRIAYVSSLPRKAKERKLLSIEEAAYSKGYAGQTCKNWINDNLRWKDNYNSRGNPAE